MLVASYQAERQPTWGDHRTPSLCLTDQPGTKPGEPLQLGLGADLEIEVNPRSMVTDLLMDVRIARGRFEAPEFRIAGPRISQRPAKRRRPEVR